MADLSQLIFMNTEAPEKSLQACRDFSGASVFIKINDEGSLCQQRDHKKLVLPTFRLDALIRLPGDQSI